MSLVLAILSALVAGDEEYFPLEKGASWVYDFNGEELIVTVDQVRTIGKREVFLLKHEVGGRRAEKWEYFARHRDGIEKLWSTDRGDVDSLPKGGRPDLTIRFGSRPGDSWDGLWGRLENGGEVEIEVPAGKFRALKIIRRARTSVGSHTCTQWYVKGIGLVKEVVEDDAGDFTTVLKKR